MTSENMSYVGLCRDCGHLCAASTDDLERPERTAKHVGGFIQDGLVIERVSDETIRTKMTWCKCQKE